MAGLSHAFAIQMLLPTVIAVVAQHNTQPPSRLFSPISSPSPKQRLADETNKLREVALGDLQPTNNNNNNKQAAKKKWNEVNVNRNILVFRMFYRIVFDLLLVCAECVTNFVCVCVFFFSSHHCPFSGIIVDFGDCYFWRTRAPIHRTTRDYFNTHTNYGNGCGLPLMQEKQQKKSTNRTKMLRGKVDDPT